ncbi:MAG: hypothetical protein JO252_03640 [Planctomycetaceae bacterium]|nr:hypothetical protein [Planctomycetaceae bacterium]
MKPSHFEPRVKDEHHPATDLIARLRGTSDPLQNEAADEVLKLRADIIRLRQVNHELANKLNVYELQAHLGSLRSS